VLASASPARLTTLRQAGIEPRVVVADVDEPATVDEYSARAGAPLSAEEVALVLARTKAEVVAARVDDALILGCDSVLELDGDVHGKPNGPEEAVARWQRMRGREGVLHTGHWLVDARARAEGGASGAGGSGATIGAVASTLVRFADVTDEEIQAYVATGEPLHVAGAFTIDGLGGPFVEGVDGDPHTVVGLSLPLLRRLLADVGVTWPSLWRDFGNESVS